MVRQHRFLRPPQQPHAGLSPTRGITGGSYYLVPSLYGERRRTAEKPQLRKGLTPIIPAATVW
jgi:hypothetical protein